jgi:hypothetical protein
VGTLLAMAVMGSAVAAVALVGTAPPASAGGPTKWNVVASPNSSNGTAVDSSLAGISCTSASFCMAVGKWTNGNSTGLVQALAERWNGTSWSLVTIASPPDSTYSPLAAVSCTSPTACVAVGSTGGNLATSRPYAEIWNGTSWSLQYATPPLPLPTGAFRGQLYGVSCTSGTCLAVGSWESLAGIPHALAMTLSGTTWTDSAPLGVGTQQVLSAVSCPTSGFCMAVGLHSAAGVLAERWSQGSWKVVATAPPAGVAATDGRFNGVSCVSATACMAVGSYPAGATTVPFGSWWNGAGFTGSTISGTQSPSVFSSVSCVSSAGCTAVGTQDYGGAAPAVIADWVGGTKWQTLPNQTSSLPAIPYALNGISCVIGLSCSAVGDQQAAGKLSTLAMGGPSVDAGYYLVASDGGVFCFGDAVFYGSTGGITLNKPIVGLADTPDGHGYWLVAADGGIFSFGDAVFYGSTGGITLNKPIVGMAATPDGHGYWLVAADGGIFSFGDAVFYGSTGGITLNQPIVAMVPSPDGMGYYLVAADGGIFSFGDAVFYGSEGGVPLAKPIVDMAVDAAGIGYWEVGADGGIFSFQVPFYGSTGGMTLNAPIVGMAATADGQGYWLAGSDGGVFNYGDAGYYGSEGGVPLNKPIVAIVAA